ncbi:hypothetical protein DIURU_003916 [Diutina rugosa]|uniref:Ribosomal protein L22 n=1 Tax=Diutina rugosa TaxID=5481 RepID=A0A642UJE5_DIURU|nr:uncharacterized protein DIURU_003916 [Diutina rugosa]KAA8900100.1 hypothetical protein DIURU_003916 [Diutina rugosa]
MVRYGASPANPAKSVKARGAYLRVSFKNTRETAQAIQGMNVDKALRYFERVLSHDDVIPFRRFNSSIGRTGQAKKYGTPFGRWPEKSVRFVRDLLINAKSNAEAKGLDTTKLKVTNIQVNQAPKMRRRTYRAHGRINAYQSSPSHIELIVTEEDEVVEKPKEDKKLRLNSRQKGRLVHKRLTAA